MIPPVTLGPWLDLLFDECARHSSAGVDDVYKFVHQGCCGPGHAVRSRDESMRRLLTEWEAADGHNGESLSTPVDPHGRYARLHLGPYRQAGGSLSHLLDAFLQSAHPISTAGVEELQNVWTAIVQSWATHEHPSKSAAQRITAQQLANFGEGAARNGWSARRHSDAYRAETAPAYRVIRVELVGGMVAALTAAPE